MIPTWAEWWDLALCVQWPDAMHPEHSRPTDRGVRWAVALCRVCPVTRQCLEDALKTEPPNRRAGVRGAMTAKQRNEEHLRRNPAPPPAPLSERKTVTVIPLRRKSAPEPAPGSIVSMPDLLTLTGVTLRQLDYWTRTGLLHGVGWDGTGNPAVGSGGTRNFPAAEVDIARSVKRLLSAGFSPREAFPLARTFAAGVTEIDLPGGFRLCDGSGA